MRGRDFHPVCKTISSLLEVIQAIKLVDSLQTNINTNTQFSYAANFQLADDMLSKLLSDTDGNDKFKAKIEVFENSVKKDTPGSTKNSIHGIAG